MELPSFFWVVWEKLLWWFSLDLVIVICGSLEKKKHLPVVLTSGRENLSLEL